MIDSLSLTLALLSAPIVRPNIVHDVRIIAPVQVASIYMTRNEEHAGNTLTTCYENAVGTCWGRD